MSIVSDRVTVTDSATALNTAGTGGQRLALKNTDGTNAVQLGDSSVAFDAGGYQLVAGATVTIDLRAGDVLYAIADTGLSVDVDVLVT